MAYMECGSLFPLSAVMKAASSRRTPKARSANREATPTGAAPGKRAPHRNDPTAMPESEGARRLGRNGPGALEKKSRLHYIMYHQLALFDGRCFIEFRE
jgi:hypothetical protein